jgi:hypothetical protein
MVHGQKEILSHILIKQNDIWNSIEKEIKYYHSLKLHDSVDYIMD